MKASHRNWLHTSKNRPPLFSGMVFLVFLRMLILVLSFLICTTIICLTSLIPLKLLPWSQTLKNAIFQRVKLNGKTVLVRVFIAVKKHHDRGNSYKVKHNWGGSLTVSGV